MLLKAIYSAGRYLDDILEMGFSRLQQYKMAKYCDKINWKYIKNNWKYIGNMMEIYFGNILEIN